ncbi:histone H1-like repetitive region-containing protein [Ilumatobacter sp.]|uniref:histone H1-like repetitive region-containing protein n=1 Tax=Ilumatobacter sp. TaxID=1967498 RepID=UPI003B520F45
MSSNKGPDHVVVDGSNIATEGRSMPSLAQLSEAVEGFMEEHPDTAITVVVDATFGHRIDKKEVKEFEAGIANNELVAPPAGAVGRGDAFVLGIADKAGASVLSNDSFQEFHGEYEWLFDEGRLIGGKPVPHVGWVWVDRVPVRGPVSRKATRGSSSSSRRSSGGRSRRSSAKVDKGGRTASKEASEPMPTPKSPPPGRAAASIEAPADDRGVNAAVAPASESSGGSRRSARRSKAAPTGDEAVNELMPFLEFVEDHPVGSTIEGVVDAYSSHGAYIAIGDTGVRGYVPLRLMADPAPRSAKQIMKVEETVTVVVVSFAAARRSIDCALPAMADEAIAEAEAAETEDGSDVADALDRTDDESPATKKAASRKTATKKTATRKTATKKAASEKAVSKKAASKKAASRKAASRKAGATSDAEVEVGETTIPTDDVSEGTTTPTAPSTGRSTEEEVMSGRAARKTATKKTATKKTATKKAAPKEAASKKTATKKAATKKAAPKEAASKKAATKKAATKKTATKKAASKTAVSKKAATKKAATKKAATKKAATKKAATKKAVSKKAATSEAATADVTQDTSPDAADG